MNREKADAPRAVIVISSHVARGSVSNRAAVFALETLGFPVWAVPTVILPWHPGHGRATRIVPPLDQFKALMADLGRAPWLGEVGAVLSGYLGEAGQAEAVASLVGAGKAKTPDAVYICDPGMGDLGGPFVAGPGRGRRLAGGGGQGENAGRRLYLRSGDGRFGRTLCAGADRHCYARPADADRRHSHP